VSNGERQGRNLLGNPIEGEYVVVIAGSGPGTPGRASVTTVANNIFRNVESGLDPTAAEAFDNKIYVANHSGNNVSIIDPRSQKMVKTITSFPPGARPFDLAFHPQPGWSKNNRSIKEADVCYRDWPAKGGKYRYGER
jgi:YVTN family beta-propeller protein